MARAIDGRRAVPELEARAVVGDDGRVTLFAPQPGLWRGAPLPGSLVTAGSPIGELEVLGVLHRLRAPEGAFGVVGTPPGKARRFARQPVDHSTALMELDPDGVAGAGAAQAATGHAASSGGPVFRVPLGGRYYAQPSPGAAPFAKAGDALKGGETVAIIEVMKTFNRVQYAGPAATVKRVVPSDGADLEAGDVLLELAE
jgi:acetyl-CoA carboxylase biotin carboxyl carrier protein